MQVRDAGREDTMDREPMDFSALFPNIAAQLRAGADKVAVNTAALRRPPVLPSPPLRKGHIPRTKGLSCLPSLCYDNVGVPRDNTVLGTPALHCAGQAAPAASCPAL